MSFSVESVNEHDWMETRAFKKFTRQGKNVKKFSLEKKLRFWSWKKYQGTVDFVHIQQKIIQALESSKTKPFERKSPAKTSERLQQNAAKQKWA